MAIFSLFISIIIIITFIIIKEFRFSIRSKTLPIGWIISPTPLPTHYPHILVSAMVWGICSVLTWIKTISKCFCIIPNLLSPLSLIILAIVACFIILNPLNFLYVFILFIKGHLLLLLDFLISFNHLWFLVNLWFAYIVCEICWHEVISWCWPLNLMLIIHLYLLIDFINVFIPILGCIINSNKASIGFNSGIVAFLSIHSLKISREWIILTTISQSHNSSPLTLVVQPNHVRITPIIIITC